MKAKKLKIVSISFPRLNPLYVAEFCLSFQKMNNICDIFRLKWVDFEQNIASAFKEIREENDFFDVTLACEDDQIEAHKVILSACSPFFKGVLKKNPHQHPLLYLKGRAVNKILRKKTVCKLGV